MQCTSFTPVYYHARDLNVGANGHPWHLYDSNACYGEERGYNSAMPLGDQYSVYDKEVLKQIIQNHEATFRYQVQELHRLYRRQRELMDEMRMNEIFEHQLLSRTSESFHSPSHSGAEFSQNCSPATNWLFANLASNQLSEPTSANVLGHKNIIAEKLKEPTTLRTASFIRKNSITDVQFLPRSSKQTGNEIISLECPADVSYDYQRKTFKVGSLFGEPELKYRSPDEISNFKPASDSDFSIIRRCDFSSSSSNIRKAICFIDLNEPIQFETLPASSSCPREAFNGHETVCRDGCVPIEAMPESIVPVQSQLLKSDDSSSDGVNSSMAIDLNSMPVNCYYETETTLESPRSMSREAKVEMSRSSIFNHAMSNRKCPEDKLIGHNKTSDNFLKTETYIDLNSSVEDEHSLTPSPTLRIKSAEDTELKGPVSPENEESSPPRGKSEDIQLETPFSSDQVEGEPFVEAAAQTLVNMGAAVYYPLENFRNLCWFAEVVSSVGDDLEYEVMDLENDEGEENALNSSHFSKAKGAGTMSRKSRKGQKRGKKQHKDCLTVTEAAGGCLKTSELKRKAGKNGCAKPRKYSKLCTSDVPKKSMSAILMQSAAAYMKQGVVQSWGWGKKKKRQGGRRCRASISFSLAD